MSKEFTIDVNASSSLTLSLDKFVNIGAVLVDKTVVGELFIGEDHFHCASEGLIDTQVFVFNCL